MADVKINVKTTYDGKGFDQAAKDAKKLEQEQIRATKAQLAEHKKVTQLTAKLDKDLARVEQERINRQKELGEAALTAGGIIVAFGVQNYQAAKEAEAAEAQLAATIKSTGGAAGQSLEALTAHAAALEDISNFSDEAVMDGQGLLLTFTNIKEVFPEATQTMLDMSVAMDQDLKSSALQLGKALNDPIKGLSALTRIGVTFTSEQKEQIKAMQEMGDIAGAQRVILEELNREFGGSAQAAREAAGGYKDVEVAWGRLQESLGALEVKLGDSAGGGGVFGAIVNMLDTLRAGADAWQVNIDQINIMTTALSNLKISPTVDDFLQLGEAIALLPVGVVLGLVEAVKDLISLQGPVEAMQDFFQQTLNPVGKGVSAITNMLTTEESAGAAIQQQQQQRSTAPVPAGTSRQPTAPTTTPNKRIPGAKFAGGGRFRIGGFGGTDSQLVQFWGTPGEEVTVKTPAQQAGATINVSVGGIGGEDLARIVRRKVQEAVSQYHESVIVPWASA